MVGWHSNSFMSLGGFQIFCVSFQYSWIDTKVLAMELMAFQIDRALMRRGRRTKLSTQPTSIKPLLSIQNGAFGPLRVNTMTKLTPFKVVDRARPPYRLRTGEGSVVGTDTGFGAGSGRVKSMMGGRMEVLALW